MIRRVRSGDIEAVAAIYNYYILNTAVSFEEVPVPVNEMKSRIDKVITAGFPWLVAEEDGRMIGYAYAGQWNVRTAYRHTAEVTVYLSHLNTSRGWGTKLYEALFAELKKMSIRMVIGGIALPNPASVALHEKFGMVKVAHYKEVGYKFSQWIDVAYWQKELTA